MKKIALLLLTVLSLIISAEPYRPYPVITVHGYNANGYNSSNFGITILSSEFEDSIANPTTPSPVPATINDIEDDYYISRNEGKRIEYNKLAYKMAELNRAVINSWANATQGDGADTIYWLYNDLGIYREIPTTGELLEGYINDQGIRVYSRPINCFLETMEFDYPEIGSRTRG